MWADVRIVMLEVTVRTLPIRLYRLGKKTGLQIAPETALLK